MSERYTQLYALEEDLYTKGSPVILSAGHLLKDNQTGRILAQLKIKNISDKTIKAAKVVLHPLDTAGKPIEGDAEKEYLDLEAEQGWEFGQKEPIVFQNQSTRGFTAEIIQVVFADNRIWESSGVTWEALPYPEDLSEELNDPELIKQYKIEYGEDAVVSPCIYKDLWLCKCGTWNKYEKCYQCGSNRNDLLPLDRIKLTENCNKRLAEEEEAREAARLEAERKTEEKRIAQEKAKQIIKKTLSIVIPVAVVVLIAIIVVTKVIIPNNNYKKAVALMELGDYAGAMTIFNELGDYKDSAELAADISDEVFELGKNYYLGEGVEKDYYKAAYMYKLAAEAGNASAQGELGYCYYYGKGVSQDYTEAVKWYRRAADQGDAAAQFNLGISYQNGEGVSQDYKEAVRWYKLSADQGYSHAQNELGLCYYNGTGVRQDYKEAVKWYRLAAEQGNSNALNNLGNCYYYGNGVVEDYDKAVEYYVSAARKGNEIAKDNLKNIGESW